jgi:hypothetical protein
MGVQNMDSPFFEHLATHRLSSYVYWMVEYCAGVLMLNENQPRYSAAGNRTEEKKAPGMDALAGDCLLLDIDGIFCQNIRRQAFVWDRSCVKITAPTFGMYRYVKVFDTTNLGHTAHTD